MSAEALKEIMTARIFERDRQEFALGDTLDIKTSIVLVALTFLASQTAQCLQSELVFPGKVFQYFSIVALVLGGVTAVAELWPRDYRIEATPDKYERWIDQLEVYYSDEPNASAKVIREAVTRRAELAKERIQENLSVNKQKSHLMMISFVCTTLAFALNLATLAMRLF